MVPHSTYLSPVTTVASKVDFTPPADSNLPRSRAIRPLSDMMEKRDDGIWEDEHYWYYSTVCSLTRP